MHQQRVISMINQKKKVSMNCYTKALNDNAPNTHRVQKCLQKLLRALHKDRHHTIQHFRHLLETSLEQVRSKMELNFLKRFWNSITIYDGPNHLGSTFLMSYLRQDINYRISSFNGCLNGTFIWRNCSVETLVYITQNEKSNKYKSSLPS